MNAHKIAYMRKVRARARARVCVCVCVETGAKVSSNHGYSNCVKFRLVFVMIRSHPGGCSTDASNLQGKSNQPTHTTSTSAFDVRNTAVRGPTH